jgi:hypothetical protein
MIMPMSSTASATKNNTGLRRQGGGGVSLE